VIGGSGNGLQSARVSAALDPIHLGLARPDFIQAMAADRIAKDKGKVLLLVLRVLVDM
jgi:hypothetical protein